MDFFQHQKVRSKKEVQIFGCSKEDSMHIGAVAHVCLLFASLFVSNFHKSIPIVPGWHGEIGEIVGHCCRGILRWTPTPPVRSHTISHHCHVSDWLCMQNCWRNSRGTSNKAHSCEHDPNFKFDKAELDMLCLSMHPIEVQGKSPLSPYWCFFSYQCRPVCLCRWGWCGWVMAGDCYHWPTPRGSTCTRWQNLNALEFPMGLASLDPPPPKFSTDLLTLQVAGRGIVPPTLDIRCGMVATSGACTWFHINSNGLEVGVLISGSS